MHLIVIEDFDKQKLTDLLNFHFARMMFFLEEKILDPQKKRFQALEQAFLS